MIGVYDGSYDEIPGRSSVFINNQDVLQLYIRIISQAPSNFPQKKKYVTCFANSFSQWGYEDIRASEEERIEHLLNFLEGQLVVFRPEMKDTHLNAKEVRLIKSNDSYEDGEFLYPIPIYSERNLKVTFTQFMSHLHERKTIGEVSGLSKEKDDCPSYLIWKDLDDKLTVVGQFTQFAYSHGGFSYISEEGMRVTDFEDNWLDKSYQHPKYMGDLLFMPRDVDVEIEHVLNTKDVYIHESPATEMAATVERVLDRDTEADLSHEYEFLEHLQMVTMNSYLSYSKKDLINFHTAMKSSTMVILAGMSGTGKSKLFQSYVKSLNLPHSHYEMIPVRPDWTDDHDLIGYVDTINMVYRPGHSGLIDILLLAEQNPDEPFFICFDEMNLAKVEHYFAQFLSILEMDLHARSLQLYHTDLANRLYNSNNYPPAINIGNNVMFVGTVNIDETTHHFSDKVLDRANVIELNVQPFVDLKQLEEKREPIKKKELISFFEHYETFRNTTPTIELEDSEMELLWDIHLSLRMLGKKFGIGPRIVNQIDKYIKNIPNQVGVSRLEALDLQIVQRILTKIRGTEEQLVHFIGTYRNGVVENSALIDCINQFNNDETHFEMTRIVIKEKAKELAINGYTL